MKFYLSIIICFIQFTFTESIFNSLEFSSNATFHALHNGAIASSTQYININPASINIEHKQFEISQLYLPADIKSSNISFSWLRKKETIFLIINAMNYGNLKDDFNDFEFKANDLSIEVGQKTKYKDLFSIGYSLGYIKSSIYKYNSSGLYNNFGIRMDVLNDRLSIGATLNHVGFQIKSYISSNEFLPTSLRYGIGFKPLYLPVSIYLDYIDHLNYKNQKLQLGFDFFIKEKINLRFSTINTRKDLITDQYYKDIFNNISLGFGFIIKNKHFNLSIQNIGPAGMIYGFSILI